MASNLFAQSANGQGFSNPFSPYASTSTGYGIPQRSSADALAPRLAGLEASVLRAIDSLYRASTQQFQSRQLANDVTNRLVAVLSTLIATSTPHNGPAATQQLQYVNQLRQTVVSLERSANQAQAVQAAQRAYLGQRQPTAPPTIYQQPRSRASGPTVPVRPLVQPPKPAPAPAPKRPRGRPRTKKDEDEVDEIALTQVPIDLPPRAARTRANKAQKQQILASDEEETADKDDGEYNEQDSSDSEYDSAGSSDGNSNKKKKR